MTLTAAALLLSLTLGQTGELAMPTAPQRLDSQPLAPEQEERVMRLGRLLRCPLCQGLSIADSPSSTARAQLDKVRELVAQGKSDQEIFDYFVARYGEFALLQPTASGSNLIVWLGPGVLLVVGFLIILGQVRRTKKGAPAPVGDPPAADEEDEYLKAVRAELDR